jgi:hypothetical protein
MREIKQAVDMVSDGMTIGSDIRVILRVEGISEVGR